MESTQAAPERHIEGEAQGKRKAGAKQRPNGRPTLGPSPDGRGEATSLLQDDASRPDEELRQALSRLAGAVSLTPCLEARLMEIAAGLTYEEIARANAISINTVKTEVRALLQALGARCRREIEDAARAARLRADDGATADEVYDFLRLRLE